MKLKKGQLPIFLVNIFFILVFSVSFITRENYEFLIYVGVLTFFIILILTTNKKVNYPNGLLWGLSAWALAHMAGGGILIEGQTLYATMLIPLIGKPYYILKYDQIVHAFGFGITTFVMWTLLKPLLKNPARNNKITIGILLVMAATGAGALNEIIEFIITVVEPKSGVGGYINNSLDLIFNLIGALIALTIIGKKEKFIKPFS